MPSHIYWRVGRYADASQANVLAAAVDEAYIAACNAQGFYPAAYYPHNIHFLWAASAGLPEEEEIAGHRSSSVSAMPVARSHAVEVHDLVARAVEERLLQVARLERELGYARARSRFGILAAASAGLLVGIGLLAFERGRSLGQAERAVSMASQITGQSETLRAELAGLRVTMEESERRHARTLAELSASTAALGQDIERNRRFAELRGRRAPTWPYTQTLDPAD
jgi:hypothetical protein